VLSATPEVASAIIEAVKNIDPSVFPKAATYHELTAAQYINAEGFKEAIAAIPEISDKVLGGIDFSFIGLNLGKLPEYNIFGETWVWDWAHIGLLLIPVISAGSQVLQMYISQKMNNSVIKDESGLQDKEAAKESQANQTSKIMMWTMPLMSLWIGFSVPAGLSLYWLVGGVIRTIEDVILTKHYRKVYDAEDAARLQKTLEQDAIEAEKERIRAERRAANPDGITENTSKKKLQQKQRKEAEAAKAAAAKEYAAKKGLEVEEEHNTALSGIKDRPYCKGRAYDPNRYNQTEE
jgi:YidC/Oxa1 family membrane protein insertase